MEKWIDPETITVWIIIVIIVIFLLVFSFIKLVYLNFKRIVAAKLEESRLQLEYQRKLLETGVLAQERERVRIAADLHDSLIGKLTSLRLKNQMKYEYKEIDFLIGESIAEARRISHDLSPPMLEFMSLYELIDEIIDPWRKDIKIQFIHDIRTDAILLDNIKIQFTRILQELVTNIHKHAKAGSILVHLRLTERWLALLICDDGCGFDCNTNKKGLGLQNIELRMLYLNGHHRITSNTKGTTALLLLNQTNFNGI